MKIINHIFNGDCEKVLKVFPDEIIDLTVTSPPYDNIRSYDGYTFNFKAIAEQLYRVTKPGGVLVWVVADQVENKSETLSSLKQAIFFKEVCRFNVHDTMIYAKKGFSNPDAKRYHQTWEYMFVFSKGEPKTFNPILDKPNIWQGKSCFGKNTFRDVNGEMKERKKREPLDLFGKRYNVWEMKTAAQENVCKAIFHPAVFPMQLAMDHILSWSNEKDIVLDPMFGSGTTILAARKLNRRYIGIEMSERYFREFSDILEEENSQITLDDILNGEGK